MVVGFCRDIGSRGSFSKNVANPRKIKLNLNPLPLYIKAKFTKERARAIFILFILGLLARLYMGGMTKNADYEGLEALRLKKGSKGLLKKRLTL